MFDLLAHIFTPRHTNNHRPRLIHPDGFFVLTTLALVFHIAVRVAPNVIHPSGNVLGYSSTITATRVLRETNAEREKAGLQPLTVNAFLSQAALSKASDMFAKQYWSHTSPTGDTPWVFIKKTGYTYSVAGENLARDFGDTEDMVKAWMTSPTHKANIVQPSYTETGIAVMDGTFQGVGTTLVVQMFGAPAKAKAEIGKTGSSIIVQAQEPVMPQTLVRAPAGLYETQTTSTLSPLQLSKSVFLAMLLLLLAVLLYDMAVAHFKKTVRVVGKNLAHIFLLFTIAIVVVLFRSGALL